MKRPPSLATDTPVPRLVFIGVLVILTITVIRCTTVYDDFPAWSIDPLQLPSPIIGVTPAISMALDLLTLLACICCLIGSKYAAVSPRWVLFLAIGCAAVVYHIFTPSVGSLENSLAGMHLTASLVSAIAIAAASYHPRVRMLTLSVLSAVVILLAFKGVSNYFIEQPEMAQMFAQEKDRYIAAQGWSPGSANALAYERRLIQREATGWFGLSNVYASITGAGCAIFFSLVLPVLWPRTPFSATLRTRIALIVCTLVAAMSLVLAGSKGGTAAAGIGILLSLFGTWACLSTLLSNPERHIIAVATRLLGYIVPLAVLGAVALRGLIGERIGELSILFRWFYLQAAARIYASSPLWGVGPAGFKDAYMLAKNPISPEDVISPHSIYFDLAATLGLGGVGFGIILVVLSVFAAMSLFPDGSWSTPHSSKVQENPDGPEQTPLRADLRLALIPTVVGVLISAWLEQQVATPTSTLVRLGGLFIGGLTAAIISQFSREHRGLQAMSVAAACGAFVIIAHSQIEMTFTTPGASLFACVLLGLAAAPGLRQLKGISTNLPLAVPELKQDILVPQKHSRNVCSVMLLVLIVICLRPFLLTIDWESNLRSAASVVAPSTQFHVRAAALSASPQSPTGDSFELLIRDVEQTIGKTIPRNAQAFDTALFDLRVSSTQSALQLLEDATRAWPTHLSTSRAASRVAIANYQLATAPIAIAPALATSALAAEYFDKAVTLASNLTIEAPSSPAYSWLATLLEERYRQSPSTAVLDELVLSLKNATALAPYEPVNFQRLAKLYASTDPVLAAKYAERALKLNSNLRLDPLRLYSDSDRAELEALIMKLK